MVMRPVMVVVMAVVILLLLLEITHEPAEEVAGLVDDEPEHEGVDQLEDEELLQDDVGEVHWKKVFNQKFDF